MVQKLVDVTAPPRFPWRQSRKPSTPSHECGSGGKKVPSSKTWVPWQGTLQREPKGRTNFVTFLSSFLTFIALHFTHVM